MVGKSHADIFRDLEEMAVTLLGEDCKLSQDAKLPLADIGFSSLTFIEFIVSVEEVMQIEFRDDDLEDLAFNDLQNLCDMVCKIQSMKVVL